MVRIDDLVEAKKVSDDVLIDAVMTAIGKSIKKILDEMFRKPGKFVIVIVDDDMHYDKAMTISDIMDAEKTKQVLNYGIQKVEENNPWKNQDPPETSPKES